MTEQEVPQVMPAEAEPQIVPPAEPPKKSLGVLWSVVILAVMMLGGASYILYAQLSKPAVEEGGAPPTLATQDTKPEQGSGVQPSSPSVESPLPGVTSSDSLSDIEKDLSGTAIEAQNTTEFDADLQSL